MIGRSAVTLPLLVYHAAPTATTRIGRLLQFELCDSRLSTLDLNLHVARHPRTRRRRRAVSRDRFAAGGWRARICSSARRASARSALRWRWPRRCCASEPATTRWNRAAAASRAGCSTPATIPISTSSACRRTNRRCRIALFIGDKEHRNQEGLCHRIALQAVSRRPQGGDHRRCGPLQPGERQLPAQDARGAAAAVAADPDRHEPEQAVADDSLAVADRAISSRWRRRRSRRFLLDSGAVAAIASRPRGSPRTAKAASSGPCELADPALWQFRAQLAAATCRAATPNAVRLAKSIQTFVDEAGKEALAARAIGCGRSSAFAEEFYRGLLRAEVRGDASGDELLQASVCQSARTRSCRSAHRVTNRSMVAWQRWSTSIAMPIWDW